MPSAEVIYIHIYWSNIGHTVIPIDQMLIKSEPFHAHLPASKWPFHFLLGGHLPSYLRQIIRSLVDPYKVVAMRILKTNWMLWGSNCQVDVDAISWPVHWIKYPYWEDQNNGQYAKFSVMSPKIIWWLGWEYHDSCMVLIMIHPTIAGEMRLCAPDPTWGLNFWSFKMPQRTPGKWMIWSCWRMRRTVVGRLDEPVFF